MISSHSLRAFAFLLAFSLAASAFAQVPQVPRIDAPSPAKSRPKIGLALSGGGARGAAHVGVIKVLEELRIPIDYIAGTSMGALVGAAYASGTSIDELERRLESADWDDLLTDTSPREDRSFQRKEEDQTSLLKLELGVKDGSVRLPAGAISGQKLDTLFSLITRSAPGSVEFDRLPIPFRAVATDAETGRMVVFSRGRLPDAMRASMSVPGAIAPYAIGDNIYLDGGLTRNLPVDVVRKMGADIVIAVNISSPLLKRSEILSIVGVSMQMINILTEQNMRESLDSLKASDILISPPLDTIGSTDFALVRDAITLGAAAARDQAPQLGRLSASARIFADHRSAQSARAAVPFTANDRIDEIRVVGLKRANEQELRRTLGVSKGDPVDFKKLNVGISRVYGSGYFERVNYGLDTEGNRNILAINALEKPWGPNYLRFGLSMAADTAGEGRFNLLVRYQQTQFNSAGAEWRHDLQVGRDRRFSSQFQQPFGGTGIANSLNVQPGIEIVRRPIDLYLNGSRAGQYQITSETGNFDFGADLGRDAIARLGIVRGNTQAVVNIGALLPDFKSRQGGIRFRLLFDNLDDANFPRAGRMASVDYFASLKSIGASNQYRKAEINYQDNISFGRHTLSVAGRYGRISNGTAPIFDQFSLGGFLQLSGFRPGELIGERVSFGRLAYFQQMSNLQNPFGKHIYAGASLELGRA
ncbi:MAG: patatin-like phospholipase family protein, partial [Usitatibacteraceae bacterium]